MNVAILDGAIGGDFHLIYFDRKAWNGLNEARCVSGIIALGAYPIGLMGGDDYKFYYSRYRE